MKKILLISLLLFAGCTQYIVRIPDKNVEVQVNTIFEDKEISGLEWVFSDGSYFSIDKTSSKVNPEWMQMLQYLKGAGLLNVPAAK